MRKFAENRIETWNNDKLILEIKINYFTPIPSLAQARWMEFNRTFSGVSLKVGCSSFISLLIFSQNFFLVSSFLSSFGENPLNLILEEPRYRKNLSNIGSVFLQIKNGIQLN